MQTKRYAVASGPERMGLEEFIGLQACTAIDTRIEEQVRRFMVLTVAWSGEVRGTMWTKIDMGPGCGGFPPNG